MSASFVAASTQRLSNGAAPVTAPPFTVGFWAYPTQTAASEAIWNLGGGAANHYFEIGQTTSTAFTLNTKAGGSTGTATSTTTITANQWYFFVGRYISAASRRLSVLRFDGVSVHSADTTSLTPTAPTSVQIGSRNSGGSFSVFFDGRVAEYWMTSTDIQADGLALQDETLRQLAYGGPLSIPHIGASVIEYRSLRKHPSSDGDDPNEILSNIGQQTWTNTGVVTIGEHPPLPYWFVRPSQTMRNLVI